jgi:hypothetical protein
MRVMRMIRMRTRVLLRSNAVDRDLNEEMRELFDRLVDEKLAIGMTLEQARTPLRSTDRCWLAGPSRGRRRSGGHLRME